MTSFEGPCGASGEPRIAISLGQVIHDFLLSNDYSIFELQDEGFKGESASWLVKVATLRPRFMVYGQGFRVLGFSV